MKNVFVKNGWNVITKWVDLYYKVRQFSLLQMGKTLLQTAPNITKWGKICTCFYCVCRWYCGKKHNINYEFKNKINKSVHQYFFYVLHFLKLDLSLTYHYLTLIWMGARYFTAPPPPPRPPLCWFNLNNSRMVKVVTLAFYSI